MIRIQGIDHLVLRVRDLSAALHFYVDLLGCTVERRQEEIGLVQLRAGAQLIDLVPLDGKLGRVGGAGPGVEGRNVDHVCLRVETLDEPALRRWLTSQGVTVDSYGSRYGAEGEGPSLYLFDPDGNALELKGPPWPPGLHEALDQSVKFGSMYGTEALPLFNHLPMALGALGRLGAPREALQRHIDHWAPLSRPADDEGLPTPSVEEALRRVLAAPEAQAFHVAIRLAYALQSGHRQELDAALKTTIGVESPLSMPVPAGQGRESLREVIDAVRADAALAMPAMPGTLITTRMQHAARLPGFDGYVERPRLTDALAEASLAVYLSRHQFASLHLVTGTHAVRVLLEACASCGVDIDEGQVLRTVWRAWLGTYLSELRPAPAWALVHAGQATEEDWTRALPSLHASMNDHRIKIADAAREEWRHRGWPGYALCLRAEGAAK
jgi:catechol 2,3-dioxygenase-like lactoylglutathione lyase family enzyme